MASFETAYAWAQTSEDAANAHKIEPDAPPKEYTGPLPCHVISGINSGAWPQDYAFIASLPQDQRGPAVKGFYFKHFWLNGPSCSSWYEQLASDEVAKRVFDMAVNGGSGAAVKCLQRGVNTLLPDAVHLIVVDGGWGPNTLQAANGCAEDELVSAFQQARTDYYKAVVAANPQDAKYLESWTARALR